MRDKWYRWAFLLIVWPLVTFGSVAASGHGDWFARQTTDSGQQDVPLVSRISVDSLPAGRHDFYLETGTRASGSPLLVPVIVIKGKAPGKRLLLTAAIHGDELNGIAVIHRLSADLTPEKVSGAVIMVPGVNPTGIERHSRFFQSSQNGGSQVDLNRVMPGDKRSRGPGRRVVSAFWEGVVDDNVDLAIDLHTQTRGTAYPLFVFADFRNKTVKQMAYDLGPEVIKDDRGQRGTLETSLLMKNIPAVTFEIGAPKVFQMDLVARAQKGILAVMKRHGILSGKPKRQGSRPIVGTKVSNIATRQGGFAYIEVSLLQKVKKGQVLARVFDPFGNQLDRYVAPHDGYVLAHATDPVREQGSLLVRLLR